MKKTMTILIAAMLLAGCSSSKAAATATPTATAEATKKTQTVGEYTLYNATGENVSELYLYKTGATDKGTNLAGDKGFRDAHAMYVEYDASKETGDVKLTLEFKTASGYTASFTTLSIETAPISLIAEDAVTGATKISFKATQADYMIYNETGEKVTDLYIYPTGATDKGSNLIAEAAEIGGTQEVKLDSVPAALIKDGKIGEFTLEFKTAGGYTGKFETLSYENAAIQLIAEDAKTGATAIAFGAPAK